MILDADKLEADESIRTDICIIGGGSAGITLALELEKSKLPVCVLEAGDFEFNSGTQRLYDEENEGTLLPEGSHYLYHSRLRQFGGSTNHWAGYLRSLAPIDFQKRDWIEHSGWPFSFKSLQPYYNKACSLMEVTRFGSRFSTEADTLLKKSSLFTSKYFHITKIRSFGKHFERRFRFSRNLKLILNANVTAIVARKESSKIEKVEVKNSNQEEITVRAKKFILATGGIENARLLLYSAQKKIIQPNPIVGRFFMEHPHIPAGSLVVTQKQHLMRYYAKHFDESKKHHISAAICPTEKALKKYKILNMNVQMIAKFERIHEGKKIDTSNKLNMPDYPLFLNLKEQEVAYVYLKLRAEQSPNPESRVILSDKKNVLGYPKAHLKWLLTEQDLLSAKLNLHLLGKELGHLGIGRLYNKMHDKDLQWPEFTYGGSHHMGTTRMNTDPKKGVVDEDGRLHGYSNFFVAGSSVFPTGGGVNPTLTIMALALRLAEHLKR